MESDCRKQNASHSVRTFVAGSLAATGILAYLRYRRDMKDAKARVSSGSILANTAFGPIEYAEAGTGPPVLAVHGAGGGFDQGLEFARPLIDHGFRVIAPSRFGYLRTPLPKDASPIAQADAYVGLIDMLQIDTVAVVAASAGAPSAMQLCLRYPDRCTALVLIVPLAYSGEQAADNQGFRELLINTATSSDFLFWSMSKLARNTMFRTILGTPPEDVKSATANEQERIQALLAHIQPISRRKGGLRNEAVIAKRLPRYDLDRLQLPTLIIAVENCLYKTYPGARYTAQAIADARFLSYPKGGHLALGHENELWSEVTRFLNGVNTTLITELAVQTRLTTVVDTKAVAM